MNKTCAVSLSLPFHKLFFMFLSVACLVFFSTAARAAGVEGCNPAVTTAMNAKAQAQVAYDVAVTEQTVDKPDSVLALNCFNKAAGVSAERGGNLFSGSFIGNTNFASVITDALSAFFQQFSDSVGYADGTNIVKYDATNLEDSAECPGIEDYWTQIKERGVAKGVPYVTLEDLITGSLPAGVGEKFQKNWEKAAGTDGIFQTLSNAIGQLPVAAIPAFTNLNSVCAVLGDAGVSAGGC